MNELTLRIATLLLKAHDELSEELYIIYYNELVRALDKDCMGEDLIHYIKNNPELYIKK